MNLKQTETYSTYSEMEEVILFTRIPYFRELPVEYKRQLTIYALCDENHFCPDDNIFFSDFMPLLLLQFHQGKFSAQEIIYKMIDYVTKQLLDSLEKMYESCVWALVDEKVIPCPKDWDKPQTPEEMYG